MDLLKLTPSEFKKIAGLVYEKTGIHIDEAKLSLLSNRLRKRLKALSLQTFEDYYRLLRNKEKYEEELPHFLSAVTTNETYFFRNDQLWTFFGEDLIKHFTEAKKAGNKSIRIWSAACSTGAEAYTTAILLRERLPNLRSWDVKIIGSDISQNVLDAAKAGLYAEYAVSRTSKERIKKWFSRMDDKFQLKDEIRGMVEFKFHNLRDSFPNGRFDLIFLRNVLMYFDMKMKKRVVDVVCEALAPGGFLIIGDVDPVRTIPELRNHMSLEYKRPGTYQKPISGSVKPQAKQELVTK